MPRKGRRAPAQVGAAKMTLEWCALPGRPNRARPLQRQAAAGPLQGSRPRARFRPAKPMACRAEACFPEYMLFPEDMRAAGFGALPRIACFS